MWAGVRAALVLAFGLASGPAASAGPDDQALLAAFAKTVFGSEYASGWVEQSLVRRFEQPVRVFIDDRAALSRKAAVARFIRDIARQVHGLDIAEVGDRRQANFRVYIVDRAGYGALIRGEIYRDRFAAAPGRCFVRAVSSGGIISGSDAVIVSDEGEFLFHRCMVEEILQGLGPINDSTDLPDSVFNDTSHQSTFTLTDRFILNMLYDRRISAGMSAADTTALLPFLLPEIRQRVGAR